MESIQRILFSSPPDPFRSHLSPGRVYIDCRGWRLVSPFLCSLHLDPRALGRIEMEMDQEVKPPRKRHSFIYLIMNSHGAQNQLIKGIITRRLPSHSVGWKWNNPCKWNTREWSGWLAVTPRRRPEIYWGMDGRGLYSEWN